MVGIVHPFTRGGRPSCRTAGPSDADLQTILVASWFHAPRHRWRAIPAFRRPRAPPRATSGSGKRAVRGGGAKSNQAQYGLDLFRW